MLYLNGDGMSEEQFDAEMGSFLDQFFARSNGIGGMFAEVSDEPLVNVYDPYEDKVQRLGVGVETNDEQCRMEISSPDWKSLTVQISTPAGAYLLTVNHDGVHICPSPEMPQPVASIGNPGDPDYVAVELVNVDPQGEINLVAHTALGDYILFANPLSVGYGPLKPKQ